MAGGAGEGGKGSILMPLERKKEDLPHYAQIGKSKEEKEN